MAIVINTDNKNNTTTINVQRYPLKSFINKIKSTKSSFNSPPYARMVAQSEYNGGVALGQNSQISMPSLHPPSSNKISYPPYARNVANSELAGLQMLGSYQNPVSL